MRSRLAGFPGGDLSVAGGALRAVVFVLLSGLALSHSASADGFDRIGELERLLRDGPDYRVRLQAAFSLGRAGERRARRSLERSLADDDHPAVRAAAAAALARLGDAAALGALQNALRDRSASVRSSAETAIVSLRGSPNVAPRWGDARYAVGVGQLGNRSAVRGDEMSRRFRSVLQRELRQDAKFVVRPDDSATEFEANVRRHRLDRYWLEGTIGTLRRAQGPGIVNVRCEISLMVLTDPDRNLRMMLQSAGTAQEREALFTPLVERRMQEQSLESAVRGAVSRLARTLAANPNVAAR